LNILAYIYNIGSKSETYPTSVAGGEKTEVVYGTSNVLNTEIQSFSNARVKVDTCMDYTCPSLTLGIKSIRKSFLDANGRDAVQDAKIVSWTILTAIYNNELVEEPERREIIISNIERQKDLLLINILGQK